MRTRILMTSTDYPRLQQCFAVKDASICCIISSQTAQFVLRNVYRKLKRVRRGEKLQIQVTMYRTITARSVDTTSAILPMLTYAGARKAGARPRHFDENEVYFQDSNIRAQP